MNPQTDQERTETVPALVPVLSGQAREAAADTRPALSAEQVYAQRLAETSLNGGIPTPAFIP
jgi:hypothetical protein